MCIRDRYYIRSCIKQKLGNNTTVQCCCIQCIEVCITVLVTESYRIKRKLENFIQHTQYIKCFHLHFSMFRIQDFFKCVDLSITCLYLYSTKFKYITLKQICVIQTHTTQGLTTYVLTG